MVTECLEKADCDLIETFAREIRAGALEEAAALLEGDARFVTKPYFGSDFQDARYECAGAIRKLKATALAAKESEK